MLAQPERGDRRGKENGVRHNIGDNPANVEAVFWPVDGAFEGGAGEDVAFLFADDDVVHLQIGDPGLAPELRVAKSLGGVVPGVEGLL